MYILYKSIMTDARLAVEEYFIFSALIFNNIFSANLKSIFFRENRFFSL